MCSDLDYEGMVITINHDMESIASLNYDKGIDKLEVTIHPLQKGISFLLSDFLEVVEKAKHLAIKCAEEDLKRDQNI